MKEEKNYYATISQCENGLHECEIKEDIFGDGEFWQVVSGCTARTPIEIHQHMQSHGVPPKNVKMA